MPAPYGVIGAIGVISDCGDSVGRPNTSAEAAWKIPLRYGIPHHGVMMVMAIQGFFVIGLLWLQLVWTLRLNMERELIWFGASMLTTLAPNLLALHMLRLLERPSSGSETRTI